MVALHIEEEPGVAYAFDGGGLWYEPGEIIAMKKCS